VGVVSVVPRTTANLHHTDQKMCVSSYPLAEAVRVALIPEKFVILTGIFLKMKSFDRILNRCDLKSFLDSCHVYFALFSSFFALLLIIPFATHTEIYSNGDIFQSSESVSRVKMVSYIAIGISFPLLVDGLLDLSIKNLLKRWIYWGMLSSIIIPSALNLVACIEDIPSLYVFSALLGLILRYMFLLANTLAAEFSSLIKLSIIFVASIRVLFIFLWSIALFHKVDQSFDKSCQILFFLCDLSMLLLLLSTFRSIKQDFDPARLCLKVSSVVLILLLLINVVTFCAAPSSVVTQLLKTSKASSTINLLKACIMAVATLLPNRIYRTSAEDLNVSPLLSSPSGSRTSHHQPYRDVILGKEILFATFHMKFVLLSMLFTLACMSYFKISKRSQAIQKSSQ
jgi:hypothetical protein